jgi:5'-nucleotidase
MLKILVTNDDGVQSAGIHVLAEALRGLGEVTIVAPVAESSAIGHALTLARPLRLEQVSERVYSVDGTPTDCVNIGITVVLRGRPDLVVSGINKGYNLGDDVTYSGTVAGALEGALLGIPSVAVSLERTRGDFDFSRAASAAATVAAGVARHGLPPRTLVNINVPRIVTGGFRVTVQSRRNHQTRVTESVDPRGRPYYWIEEGESEWVVDERSDYHAVKAGFISITPLQPDLTHHDALNFISGFISGLPFETPVAVD